MQNFWDFSVWGGINLVALLLFSLLAANVIKRVIPFLKNSLIPTSVLGGILLLISSIIFENYMGCSLFDIGFFGGNGSQQLEVITYHCLALGFIATAFKPVKERFTKKRNVEIFNTGVTTVATYLLQAGLGLGITMAAAYWLPELLEASGVLLAFGYGQGTGQALNYGNIYETDYGFVGGKSFGLTIAALGFLSASFGGVIHLNILKLRKKINISSNEGEKAISSNDVQGEDEIPMNGSMDKLSVQMAWVFCTYMLTFFCLYYLGELLPSLKSVLYGFNFLVGVLIATVICTVVGWLRKLKIVKRQYINTFLMKRISGFFFDLMVVAGIAAIKIDVLKDYWTVIIILGVVGLIITYIYNYIVAKTLFKEYQEEQFLAMYGMLTGTASTGVILLREIDKDFETPVADNLVYQNLPAIIFGFPMMYLAILAPQQPVLTLAIVAAFFLVMNIILFRSKIFRRKNKEK